MLGKDNRFAWSIIIITTIVTLLHYFTNIGLMAFHSVYRLLYYIPIIMAAFRFGLKGSLTVSLLISLFYTPQVVYYFTLSPSLGFDNLLEVLLYNVIAALTGVLIEVENQQKEKLAASGQALAEANRKLQKNYQAMETLKNYFGNILESLPVGLLALDSGGVISFANQLARKLCPQIQVGGEFACSNLLASSQKLKDIISQIPEIRRTVSWQERLPYPPPDTPYQITVFPLKENQGETIGVVLLFEDLTELHSLHEQIRRSEKLASLGQLVAGIAHEIRNPLGIIKTTTQLMQNDFKENQEVMEFISVILEEAERMQKKVNEFLNFAKPSKAVKQFFELNKLIHETINFLEKYLSKGNIKVEQKLESIPHLYGGPEKIRQVLVNLIINAFQAMPDGGTLTLFTESRENDIILTVSDTGTGISEENLASIFNPFFTTKEEGIGLGLATVNRIIEDHQGTITVKSKVGVGTTFTITLPIDKRG